MVAAAIGSADDEPQLTTVAGGIFRHWRDALTRAFVADGFEESDAASLAIMCIASLEGAVVLCRSTRSVDPLRDVANQVEFLIKSREFVRLYGLPDSRSRLGLSPPRADEVAVDGRARPAPIPSGSAAPANRRRASTARR